MSAPVPATKECYVLAEGPFWDAPRSTLLWVDIEAGLVLRGALRGDGRIDVVECVAFDGRVGAVAPSVRGDWIVALEGRLVVRDRDGALTEGPLIVPAGSGRRLNDGKPDPAGRYLVGTLRMDDGVTTAEELVVVDGDVRVVDGDLTLSNGLAWSSDGGTLYSVDTGSQTVYRRPWNVAVGTAGKRTVHLRLDDGFPDGMTIDGEDHLWIAIWGAGQVRRFAPDGSLVDTIELPVPDVSSVAFAGEKLDTLVVTTSCRDLDARARETHPDAGRLFTLDPGVRGAPQALWSGQLPASNGTIA